MAAKFSSELGFFKVVLEGDTLQIVHALKKDGRYLSTHGHLIENTQVILNSLQNWQINYANQNVNGEAQRLAKKALYLNDEQCFIEETPDIF
jgi:hypothetical protein